MTVPDFQTLIRPTLEEVSKHSSIGSSPLVDLLSDKFNLSPEDRSQTIASGMTTIRNRVLWAASYLYQAGLVEKPSRGLYSISETGKTALQEHPTTINYKVLKQYPKFLEFLNRGKNKPEDHASLEVEINSVQTPLEALEKSYRQLVAITQQELLDKIINSSPDFFEQLILDLLVAMGYGGSQKDASQRMGKTGDGGIDGVIKEDSLGLDVIYVQAKRYKESNSVPVGHVRDFAGSLQAARANKGVFVTTSSFTKDAYEFVAKVHSRIILIDGEALTKLLYEHSIGVRTEVHFEVKKIDEGYFSE